MRTFLAAILFVAACTSTESITDLGELSSDGKADVQTIKVPLRLAAGESAEFALTVDGPFQAKATYAQNAAIKLSSGQAQVSGVQPVLVIEAPRTPTEYILQVTNSSATAISGTFEIGNAAPSCGDATWIAWFDILTTKLEATNGFIDNDERSAINGIIAGRPCKSTTDGAYTRWHQAFDEQLVGANGFIDNDERQHLDIIKAERPAAESEGAYLVWLPKFAAKVRGANGFIDNDERTELDLRLAVRPKLAPSDPAYIAWAAEFRPVLAGVNGFIDNDERTAMQTLLAGKPCGTGGPEAQVAWNQIAGAASGEAGALVEAARPTACR